MAVSAAKAAAAAVSVAAAAAHSTFNNPSTNILIISQNRKAGHTLSTV